MFPYSVVECFYILKYRLSGLPASPVFSMIHQLLFQSAEKALCYSVICQVENTIPQKMELKIPQFMEKIIDPHVVERVPFYASWPAYMIGLVS